MNTFLPYASFEASALVLDRARLGKQRVEALQILYANTGRSSGWRHHPATLMWKGYEAALARYGLAMCAEWTKRGYNDTTALKIVAVVRADQLDLVNGPDPLWLGNASLHSSHRSNLLRKMIPHYGLLDWTESPDQLYVWPHQALHLTPGRAHSMDATTTQDQAVNARQEQLAEIQAVADKAKASVNASIGEKNVDRFNKRIENMLRVAKSAFSRIEKQEKYAARPKRLKKAAVEAPQA